MTGVKLKTIESSIVQFGSVLFGTGDAIKTQYIQSMVDLALYAGTDPKSATEGHVGLKFSAAQFSYFALSWGFFDTWPRAL